MTLGLVAEEEVWSQSPLVLKFSTEELGEVG